MFHGKLLIDKGDSDEILINNWKETKDQKIINALIKRHIYLVHHIAHGYQQDGLNKHDLVAEGILGLIHSIEKFQCTKNVKFSTYSYYWIRAKINLYAWKMRNILHISQSSKNSFIFSLMKEIYEEKMTQEEAIKKIAKKEKLSLKNASDHMKLLSIKMKSLNEKLNGSENNENDNSLEDFLINDDHQQIMEELDIKHIMSLIREILFLMTKEEQQIINERWLSEEPSTLKEIGIKIGMTTEGVRKLELRTINKLRDHITSKIYNEKDKQKLMSFIMIMTLKLNYLLD